MPVLHIFQASELHTGVAALVGVQLSTKNRTGCGGKSKVAEFVDLPTADCRQGGFACQKIVRFSLAAATPSSSI